MNTFENLNEAAILVAVDRSKWKWWSTTHLTRGVLDGNLQREICSKSQTRGSIARGWEVSGKRKGTGMLRFEIPAFLLRRWASRYLKAF